MKLRRVLSRWLAWPVANAVGRIIYLRVSSCVVRHSYAQSQLGSVYVRARDITARDITRHRLPRCGS